MRAARAALALHHEAAVGTSTLADAHHRLASVLGRVGGGGERGVAGGGAGEDGGGDEVSKPGESGGAAARGAAQRPLSAATLASVEEAVAHFRAAAKLKPSAYARVARTFTDFEDAVRLNKEADRRERLDREKMVEGMAASVRASEEEKEEDAAFEAEYAEAEAARRARRK